jgi:hypothetical protein
LRKPVLEMLLTMFSKTLIVVGAGLRFCSWWSLISSDECEQNMESSTGGQGENQHILSLRWRAIATAAGDEAALLRAAYSSIASTGREFTTYSETDSSTLWLISS